MARFPATGGSSLRTHITFRCRVCVCVCACVCACSVVSEPMDCSLPGFSVHGISQARILEWVPHVSSASRNLGHLHSLSLSFMTLTLVKNAVLPTFFFSFSNKAFLALGCLLSRLG